MSEIKKILVLGAGVMGHGIAQVFALKKMDVFLVDDDETLLARGLGWIRENLEYRVELGNLDHSRVEETMAHIRSGTALEQVAPLVDFVTEAVTENLELKREVFKQLGELTGPEVILATNTSSYDINEFCQVALYPERVLGTHWFHPPPITPGVEVIPGRTTSQETVARTVAFMEQVGKFPTLCRSAPGFVANRIQIAMAAEALAIVEEGLASPKEVDRIVKSCFGFRLSAFGPFEIMDQAGLDTYRAVFEYLYGQLNREQFRPSPVFDRHLEKGRLGLKSNAGFYDYEGGAAEAVKAERDRKLYARLRLFRQENIPGHESR